MPFTTLMIRASADNSIEQTTIVATPQSTIAWGLPLKIGSFYSLLGVGLWNSVRIQWLQAHEAMIGCGLLWLGFLLAISFTEAWVKFQAPFLPRHYGLDVGRIVFPVLNAVEIAFCGTLWSLQFFSKTGRMPLLIGLTLLLLSQVFIFTPQLVLLGKHIIADAFSTAEPSWSLSQNQMYNNLCTEVKTKPRPSTRLHMVYVLQEVVKVVLIGALVGSCRRIQ